VGVVKRSRKLKTSVPNEIAAQRPDIAAKLFRQCEWNEKGTAIANYQKSGFANDPNKHAPVGPAGDSIAERDTLSGVGCAQLAAEGRMCTPACHASAWSVRHLLAVLRPWLR
jgi:hypothetical protein